jgi:hypothetical protein
MYTPIINAAYEKVQEYEVNTIFEKIKKYESL